MWDAGIIVPTTKVPVSVATFVSYILPPLLLYFTMAVLVITPQTRALRVACWPVVALLAWRATFGLDMTPINSEEIQVELAIPMLVIVTRALYWGLASHLRPVNSTPSTLMDAFDLVSNLRGYGWDWSRGLYVPRDTRPSDRIGFVSHVILSAVVHAFLVSTFSRALQSFPPVGLGSFVGGSIFDETLPFHVRYFRSSIICIMGGIAAYSSLQMNHDLGTLVGVLFLGQDPAQWPPSLDAPWRATSLADFWGRRWHQMLRHISLVQGGYPLGFLFGRAGLVIGAFLSSAVFHHILFHSLNRTSQLWWMLAGFGMMGPGILAERAFERWTGRKVGGFAGWVWTMAWLVLWGNWIMDGFVRAGLFRSSAWVDVVSILPTWVERTVMGLDTWLHAV
ncbi:hypothetical protein EV363DRAFT_1349496 [Boletus edulis]|nr:hypothetical protein EV363DRAFT_1349496 [Boletus edulis]